jgi:serine/threonine protein kinase
MSYRSYDDGHTSTLAALTKQPHYPAGLVLVRNAPLFRALGLVSPPDQRLGKGAFGVAYETSLADRSVLKLTRDPSEVQAATLLQGKESKRIVHIHGVWALPKSSGPGLLRWYLVHRDYLSPLSKQDTFLIEVIFSLFDNTSLDLVIPRSVRQHSVISKWRGYLRDELSTSQLVDVSDEGGVYGGNPQMMKRALQLLLHIGEAVDEMHQAGIDWEDIHSGNLMRDTEGRLVIADIGWGLMHDDFERQVPWLDTEVIAAHKSSLLRPSLLATT